MSIIRAIAITCVATLAAAGAAWLAVDQKTATIVVLTGAIMLAGIITEVVFFTVCFLAKRAAQRSREKHSESMHKPTEN